MCGIVGRVSNNGSSSFSDAVAELFHRGPDAGGELSERIGDSVVQLGHRRLSIIEVGRVSNQPFWSSDKRKAIVFNGEIYNYKTLRLELISEGHEFRTSSDTEVLLVCYEHYGIAGFSKLNGMFAFSILDMEKNIVVLARDHFGIKPLYYTFLKEGGIVFASEMKALAVCSEKPLYPNPQCIPEFLLNGFLYEPSTGVSEVFKIKPGSYLTVDIEKFHTQSGNFVERDNRRVNYDDFDSILVEQLNLESNADVPLGLFFSGGIDSSVIAAGVKRGIAAIHIDYEGTDRSEYKYVEQAATQLGLNVISLTHHDNIATPENILEDFNIVASGSGEPISDFTYIATKQLSRVAREAGFKVMLSGLGGDEMFAGYPRYWAAQNWKLLRRLRLLVQLGSKIGRKTASWSKRADRLNSFARSDSFVKAYTSLIGYFSFDEVLQMTSQPTEIENYVSMLESMIEPMKNESLLRKAMHLDRTGFLSHNLTVADRASMSESIEMRVPLLAGCVDRIALQLEDDRLLTGFSGKVVLKNFLAKYMSRSLLQRKKIGFNPPLKKKLAILGESNCKHILHDCGISKFIDPKFMDKVNFEHFSGARDNTYRLWQLIYLSLWLESF